MRVKQLKTSLNRQNSYPIFIHDQIITTMKWIAKHDIFDEDQNKLFTKLKVYEEYDDRGEADDIAICLLSNIGRKVYIADKSVRDNFEEAK